MPTPGKSARLLEEWVREGESGRLRGQELQHGALARSLPRLHHRLLTLSPAPLVYTIAY